MGYLECKKIEVYTINQRTKTMIAFVRWLLYEYL